MYGGPLYNLVKKECIKSPGSAAGEGVGFDDGARDVVADVLVADEAVDVVFVQCLAHFVAYA